MKISSPLALVLSVALAIATVFIIDPLDPSTLSTPFCLALILMGLSFHQSSKVVVSSSLFYCLLVVYAMIQFTKNTPLTTPHPYFWFFQRFGMFLVVCALAIYLSYYREDMQRNLSHIQDVLGKMPVPIAISDAAGYITYINEALRTLFGPASAGLIGQRYVDVFMTHIQEGKAMRYYIELFQDQTNNVHELDLRTAVIPENTRACLTCLGAGAHRNMITVLQVGAARITI